MDPADESELLSQLQEGEFWVEEEEFLREFDEVTVGFPITEAGHLQSLYSGKGEACTQGEALVGVPSAVRAERPPCPPGGSWAQPSPQALVCCSCVRRDGFVPSHPRWLEVAGDHGAPSCGVPQLVSVRVAGMPGWEPFPEAAACWFSP